MAHSYSHLYRLPTTGLRFFTVYGPWCRPDMALFLFAKAILEGTPIKLFNHGKCSAISPISMTSKPCRIASDRPPMPEMVGEHPDQEPRHGNL